MKNNIGSIIKTQGKVVSLVIIAVVLILMGTSYALFTGIKTNEGNQVVTAGDLKFTYSQGTTIDSTKNKDCFTPMTKDEATKVSTTCSYQLSITNTGSLPSHYKLTLTPDSKNNIETSKLKVILQEVTNGVATTVSGYPKALNAITGGVIAEKTIPAKSITTPVVYKVQIYVDDELVVDEDNGKTVNININGSGEVSPDRKITDK